MSFNETLGENSEINSQITIKDKPLFNPSKKLEKIINRLKSNPSPDKLKKLALSLAINISPKELKTLLYLIQTYSNTPEIQESILQSLDLGLKFYFESECEQINKREKILYTRTNSYFYFDGKYSLNEKPVIDKILQINQSEESKISEIDGESIEKENQSNTILDPNEVGIKFSKFGDDSSFFVNQKEFSFLIWIYPEKIKTSANIKEAFIAEFSEIAKGSSNIMSKFSIFLTNNLSINIKYSKNKTLHGKNGAIINNQWNCIGISIRRVKGRDNAEYLIMYKSGSLNPQYETLSYIYPEGSFQNFCIGGPVENLDSNYRLHSEMSPYFLFRGKIGSVYLFRKYFNHTYYDRITEFSNKLILRYNYDSIGNKLMLREIMDSITFKWESSCKYVVSDMNIDIRRDKGYQRVCFSTIADSLTISGGLDILIPLINQCNLKGIIYILRIIGTICQVKNYLDEIISFNFFEVLGVALEEKNIIPNEDFLYSCEDIFIYLERNSEQDLGNSLQSRAMNSIFLNKGIWKNLPFNLLKEYLEFLLKRISILFNEKEEIFKFLFVVNTLKDIIFKDIVNIKEKINEEPYNLMSRIMQEILKNLRCEDKEISELNEPKTPKNSKNSKKYPNEIAIQANVVIKILLMMIEKETEEVLIDHCLEAYFCLKCKDEEINELFERALILIKEQKDNPIIQKNAAMVAIKLVLNFLPSMWEWDNMNRRLINFHHEWTDLKKRLKKLCKSFKKHLNANNIYPIMFLLLEKEMKNRYEIIQSTLPEIRRKLNSLINILTDRISCYLIRRKKIRVNNAIQNTENDQIEIILIQDFPKLDDFGELHLKEIFEYLTQKVEENGNYLLYLYNSANFPQWVIDAYKISVNNEEQYQTIPSINRFALTIFSKNTDLTNFSKLREFLIGIGNINYNETFIFLSHLLDNLKESFKYEKILFFEFLSVLEDLLNPHFVNISYIDCNNFKKLIIEISEFAVKSAKCHRIYYPELIFADLLTLSSLLDSISPKNYTSKCICLRNGGYIRYILKFIFTCLFINPNDAEITVNLKFLIEKWKKGFNKLKKSERQKCEVISELNKELKVVKLQKLKDFDFFALYILTECTSIIIKHKDADTNNILQFLLWFIDEVDIFKILKKLSTNSSIETEMDYFSTIRQEFSKFYCTSELWQHDYWLERKYRKENPNHAVAGGAQLDQQQFTAIYMSKEKQIKCSKDSDLLKTSLLSKEWVENIHYFLIAFTSMRINLISFLSPIYQDIGTNPFLKEEILPYEFDYYEHEGKSPKKNQLEERKNDAWCQVDFLKPSGIEKIKLTNYKWKEEIKGAFLKYCQANEYDSIWHKKHYKSIMKSSKMLLHNPNTSSLKYGVNFQFDKLGRTPFLKELSKRKESQTSPQILKNTFCDELSQNLNLQDSESPKQTSKNYSDFLNQLNNTLFNISTDEKENSEDPTDESGSNYDEGKWENAEEIYSPTSVEKTIKFECKRVKIQGINNGTIEVNQDYLIFLIKNEKKHSIDSPTHNFQSAKKDIRIWKISEIHEIFARRFIHRHSAIEIFLKSGRSIYFELTEENYECQRKELLDYFTKNLRSYNISVYGKRSSKELRNYTNSWKLGNISNFQYLMILNKFASRSFHDLSQYPVFPWVIKEWESAELDFKKKENFRNLECPVGAQNPERIYDLEKRYGLCAESGMAPFHYGSHYSNGGLVLHYLQRVEPFTEQAKLLHGGRFDVPDRQFVSMKNAWNCINSSSGDVKELIPELFYIPEVLMNINHENFGIKQDGCEVWDLELPKWAANHFDLIRKNRKALESFHSNKNLHQWIDLIFGFKQSGEYAKKAYNVYFPTTYEENFLKIVKNSQDPDFINSVIQQAIHFGQTPIKLFKGQHPKKEKKEDQRSLDLGRVRNFSGDSCEMDHLLVHEKVLTMLISQSCFIVLVYDGCSVKMKRHKLRDSKIEFSYKEFIELKDTKYLYDDNSHNLSPYLLLKEEILVSGCYIDNTIKLHSPDGNLLGSLSSHVCPISAIVATDTQLFTGSLDTSIICWKLASAFTDIIISKKSILTGHISPIQQLKISEEYQILISLSLDVIFYNLRNLEITKKIAFTDEICSIGFNDYGLFVTAGNNGIKLFTLNHTEIDIVQPDGLIANEIRNIEIESTGDFILASSDDQFIIFEPFKRDPGLPIIKKGFAMFSLLQDYLIICEKVKDHSIIYTLE